MKPGSLDFSNRRNGFNTAQSFEPQNVPLLGLGTVELDSVPYRNVTEKNFTSHDTSAWLGSGTSGTVFKMNFMGKRQVAVKQIPKSDDPDEIKRLRMDLGVMIKSRTCPHIVKYLGAVGSDASVWIVMELMLCCFEKILKTTRLPVPVPVLGSLTYSVVSALNYLKEHHSTIHRDVKPSNVLVDLHGNIKLCDFGISGRLVDSQARTRGAGCAAYLSPERIDPERGTYDVRADIWSLGLSLIELATAQFPYSGCKSDFEVCAKILQAEAPELGPSFPEDFREFVRLLCIKNVEKRPKYAQLMKTKFFVANSKRSDRNSTTKNWLESVNFIEPQNQQNPQTNGHSISTNPFLPSKSSTSTTSHLTQLPLSSNSQIVNGSSNTNSSWFGASAWNDAKPRAQAVHMPQPIRVDRSLFTPVNNSVFVTGRENWTSFGSTPSAPVAINSVPVQIENQSTSKDLISL